LTYFETWTEDTSDTLDISDTSDMSDDCSQAHNFIATV